MNIPEWKLDLHPNIYTTQETLHFLHLLYTGSPAFDLYPTTNPVVDIYVISLWKQFFKGQRVIAADTSAQLFVVQVITTLQHIYVSQHRHPRRSMCLKHYILSYCTTIGRAMVLLTFARPSAIIIPWPILLKIYATCKTSWRLISNTLCSVSSTTLSGVEAPEVTPIVIGPSGSQFSASISSPWFSL